jgi:hypothetical protein
LVAANLEVIGVGPDMVGVVDDQRGEPQDTPLNCVEHRQFIGGRAAAWTRQMGIGNHVLFLSTPVGGTPPPSIVRVIAVRSWARRKLCCCSVCTPGFHDHT